MSSEQFASLGWPELPVLFVLVVVCLVLFLVVRQNRRDYLDVVDSLTGGQARFPSSSRSGRRK
jgi:hypothetical protein